MKTTPIAKPSLARYAAEPTPVLQTQDGMPGATVFPPSRRQAHCASMQLLADRSRRQQGVVQCVQSANASTAQRRPPKRRMQPEAAAELAKHMQVVANIPSVGQGQDMEGACDSVVTWLKGKVGDFEPKDLRECGATVDLIVGALTGSKVGSDEDLTKRPTDPQFDLSSVDAFSRGIHILRSNQEIGYEADHQFVVVARDQSKFDLYESDAYGDKELAGVSFLPAKNAVKAGKKMDANRLRREQRSRTKVGMNTEALQQQLLAIHAAMQGKKGFNHWERYHIPPRESRGKCAIL